MTSEGMQLGHYRLERFLGSGAMGTVYLAQDTRIARQVAIKVVKNEEQSYPNPQATAEVLRLFQREMKAIAALDHPHILQLIDFDEQTINKTTYSYLVMPYRPEGSLVEWLHRRNSTALLAPEEVVQIVRQAADALQHAHTRQVLHLDVKPSNFLMRQQDDDPQRLDLLLADFGISRFTTATTTASQAIRGTPPYMAPEQWTGTPTTATDQYALAIMAYHLLTGRYPFEGNMQRVMYQHLQEQPQPPSAFNPRVPPEVDQVILTALEKKPEERFASMRAFATAFANQMEQARDASPMPVTSGPISTAPPKSGGAATWLLQAPTQLSAPPPEARTASETAIVGPPETAQPATELAPTTPVALPIVEATLPAPSAETSDNAAAHSAEQAPHAPGHRSRARRGRLVAAGLSAGLIVVLVVLLLTGALPGGFLVNTAATAAANRAMQTGTALAGAATGTIQSQQATVTTQSQHATATTQSQQATATAQSANATATAQFYANNPYSAPVPGPGCDKGTGQWVANHPEGVQCLPDRLRLIGEPDTSSGMLYTSVNFLGSYGPTYTFPPNFMISIEVSDIITGIYTASVAIVGHGESYYFAVDDVGEWYFVTSNGSSSGRDYAIQGRFNPSVTKTITMTIRGTTGSIELNGQQVGAYQGSGPALAMSFLMYVHGYGYVQVDFQNFVFTPLP